MLGRRESNRKDKKKRKWLSGNVRIGLVLASWFISGLLGTIVSKNLLTIFSHPLALTTCQIVAGLFTDIAVLRKERSLQFDAGLLWKSAPIVFMMLATKTLTYTSYENIAVSLTHTIKASSPVFNVLLTYLAFGTLPPSAALTSLAPIVFGVVLSASSDLGMGGNKFGIACSIVACSTGVAQAIYTKHLLTTVTTLHPVLLHLYTSIAAIMFLTPYIFWQLMQWSSSGGMLTALPGPHLSGAALAGATATQFHTMLALLAGSMCCHYAQNLSSMMFLSMVPTLTHQVAGTSRRLFNIVGAILWFHTPVTVFNALGILIAIAGFAAYSSATHSHRKARLSSRSLLVAAQSSFDLESGEARPGPPRLLNLLV